MGRPPNPDKKPIPSNIRVQMHRRRKEIKKEHLILLNSQIEKERDHNVATCGLQEKPDANDSPTLRIKLQIWANSCRISKRAIDSLLCTLNACGINSVPKNHRTLLKTPLNVDINEVAGGNFWYNGLETNLKLIFSTLDRDIVISLNLISMVCRCITVPKFRFGLFWHQFTVMQ